MFLHVPRSITEMSQWLKRPVCVLALAGVALAFAHSAPSPPAPLPQGERGAYESPSPLGGEGSGVRGTPGNLPTVEAKKHENYTEKIDDKASFEMIAIPGGTYLMGSPDG